MRLSIKYQEMETEFVVKMYMFDFKNLISKSRYNNWSIRKEDTTNSKHWVYEDFFLYSL